MGWRGVWWYSARSEFPRDSIWNEAVRSEIVFSLSFRRGDFLVVLTRTKRGF